MLDQLSPAPGSRSPRKRRGRGIGSGLGKTSGRGQKGAGARAGFKRRTWFEGGQMSLARRLPKRGFTNIFSTSHQVVNVGALKRFGANDVVDGASLAADGLVPHADRPVKLLGEGEISVAIVARVHAVSASAAQKIEAAGGRVEIITGSATGAASEAQ